MQEIVKVKRNEIATSTEVDMAVKLESYSEAFNYNFTGEYVKTLINLFNQYGNSKYDFQEAYEKMMIRPKNKNYGMPSPSDWLECAGLLESAERCIESKYKSLRENETIISINTKGDDNNE